MGDNELLSPDFRNTPIANLRAVQVVSPDNILSMTSQKNWTKIVVSIDRKYRTTEMHYKTAVMMNWPRFCAGNICSNARSKPNRCRCT